VASTRSRVLVHAGRPIQALFHADCGGQLAPAEAVWGGNAIAYLPGGTDDVPAGTHGAWTFVASPEALVRALTADPRSAVGRRLEGIEVMERDASGRAEMIRLHGERTQTLRGEHLRAIVNRTFGVTAIKSTRFDVTRSAAGYQFIGTGFGHGVGLCQVGAIARARRGESVTQILRAYYPGAHVR
jgi:stage II sporulation protein D